MKFKVEFKMECVNSPILSKVILETKVPISIDTCSISQKGGRMVIEVPNDVADTVRKAFEARGVDVSVLKTPIVRNSDKCVDCGACISVCPSKTYSFDKDWKLQVNTENCTSCGLCIRMCPQGALSLESRE